jgi:hypothetical protein
MFCKLHENTVIHAFDMGNYVLHARGSETQQTFTFRLLNGKRRTPVTFQTDGNIPILLHVFAFLLFVEQNIVFIHNAAFFFFHYFFCPPFLLYDTQQCYPVSPLVIPGNAGYTHTHIYMYMLGVYNKRDC